MTLHFPPDSPHLVTPAWLAAHLDAPDLRVLDARLPESYAEGHIPGALALEVRALRHTADGVDGMLIPPADFQAAARALGIGPDTRVVIYDDYFGQAAARIAWSFLAYGHAPVALLDGGWDLWEAVGLPVSADAPMVEGGTFTAQPAAEALATLDWVRAHLAAPDVALLDVRSPAEYARGHIPGAAAWNWENGTAVDATFGRLDELRAALVTLGVTPEREVVTYCQSGMRAAHTYFLLKQLGYPRVRMYDGSWAEWSVREGQRIHAGEG